MGIFFLTFLGMPTKDREGARDGGKVCSYNGPTLSSSTPTIPLVSRNGKAYEYLHMVHSTLLLGNLGLNYYEFHLHYPVQYMMVSAMTQDPSTNTTRPSS